MTVAVIGTGNIGSRVATRLAEGGVDLVVAAGSLESAQQAADEIGYGVRVAETDDAISQAEIVIFATRFDVTKELLPQLGEKLSGKIVVDPSNNIRFEDGKAVVLNPEGVSAGQQLAALLPADAKFVKSFGTMAAAQLEIKEDEDGNKIVMFYASDDEEAGNKVAEIAAAGGWDPMKVGGLDVTSRIEMYGDLHTYGGIEKPATREVAEKLI